MWVKHHKYSVKEHKHKDKHIEFESRYVLIHEMRDDIW